MSREEMLETIQQVMDWLHYSGHHKQEAKLCIARDAVLEVLGVAVDRRRRIEELLDAIDAIVISPSGTLGVYRAREIERRIRQEVGGEG